MEPGMQAVATQALMATLDEVQPHRISLRLRVVLDSPRAHMFSQYLCGTEIPDSAPSIHEVQIRDQLARCSGYELLSTVAQLASLYLQDSLCKDAYASVRLHRDMVANVDSSGYICRRVDVKV